MDSKKLRKKYMPLVSKLNNALKYVQSQFSDLPPSEFEIESNIKPYASVKRKMETDQVQEPIELSDLVRGRLFFSDQFQHSDVVDIVKHLFGDKVIKIDKKPQKSKEHGLEYHGIYHIDMNIDGIPFELQIMPKEFKPYKDILHQIYEQLRDNKTSDKLTDKQKEFLRKTHNRMYRDLDKKSKMARKSAE